MPILAFPTSSVVSGTFADARIAESNVTQHEAALTITESQVSDLGSYLPLSGGSLTGNVTSTGKFTAGSSGFPVLIESGSLILERAGSYCYISQKGLGGTLRIRTSASTAYDTGNVDFFSTGVSKFLGAVVCDSTLTLSPGSSVTPASNGQITFEFTSNTSVTIKGKGTDGTVRSNTLTLS